MDTTESLKAYGWTMVASGTVGLIVGMTALLVHFYEPGMLDVLVASILAGVIIGTASRGVCLVMVNNNCHRPIFLWGGVLLIIGAGTAVAAELIGRLPSERVVILVAVAEFFGMAVAYANYRRYIYINEKLRQKQEELRDRSLSKIEE